MRTTRLLSTIAATALLGAGAAAAQDTKGPVKPERAPSALQNAPAEKIAPPMNAGERGSVGTTGQGSAQTLKPGSGANADVKGSGTVGASPQSDDKSNAKVGVDADAKADADVNSKTDGQSGSTELKSESDSKAQMGAEKDSSSSSTKSATEESGQASKSDTTGQGAAAGAAKLSTEQRTKITTVIKEQKVAPVEVNFEVNIGTQIPARVNYHPLPVEVIEIYPEWRGYYYILVSDQIVIIEPDTRAVVFIIEA